MVDDCKPCCEYEECKPFGIQNGDVCGEYDNDEDGEIEEPDAEFPDHCDPTEPYDPCDDVDIGGGGGGGGGDNGVDFLIVNCPNFEVSSEDDDDGDTEPESDPPSPDPMDPPSGSEEEIPTDIEEIDDGSHVDGTEKWCDPNKDPGCPEDEDPSDDDTVPLSDIDDEPWGGGGDDPTDPGGVVPITKCDPEHPDYDPFDKDCDPDATIEPCDPTKDPGCPGYVDPCDPPVEGCDGYVPPCEDCPVDKITRCMPDNGTGGNFCPPPGGCPSNSMVICDEPPPEDEEPPPPPCDGCPEGTVVKCVDASLAPQDGNVCPPDGGCPPGKVPVCEEEVDPNEETPDPIVDPPPPEPTPPEVLVDKINEFRHNPRKWVDSRQLRCRKTSSGGVIEYYTPNLPQDSHQDGFLHALEIQDSLNQAAQHLADHNAETSGMGHEDVKFQNTDPNGPCPGTGCDAHIKRAQYYGYGSKWVVENVGNLTDGQTVEDALIQWICSEEHLANLLRPEINDIGIGINGNKYVFVGGKCERGTKRKWERTCNNGVCQVCKGPILGPDCIEDAATGAPHCTVTVNGERVYDPDGPIATIRGLPQARPEDCPPFQGSGCTPSTSDYDGNSTLCQYCYAPWNKYPVDIGTNSGCMDEWRTRMAADAKKELEEMKEFKERWLAAQNKDAFIQERQQAGQKWGCDSVNILDENGNIIVNPHNPSGNSWNPQMPSDCQNGLTYANNVDVAKCAWTRYDGCKDPKVQECFPYGLYINPQKPNGDC